MTTAKKSTAGSVTAEFAVILPVVVLVVAMLINIIAVGMQQSKLHQAAAVAARQLARGESIATITTSVTNMTTASTQLSTSTSGPWASVELTSPVPGPLGLFPAFEISAQAKAPNQWTASP